MKISGKIYMQMVRELPCVCCLKDGHHNTHDIQAHHWIMGRLKATKTSDMEAIPLCEGHHQGQYDTSKVAIHREPYKWKQLYGADFDMRPSVRRTIERQLKQKIGGRN